MVNFVQVLRRVFGEHQLWRFPLQFPFMQRGNDCEKTGGLHLWERCEPIFFMLGFGQYHQGQTTHLYCAPYRDLAQPLPFSKTKKQTFKWLMSFKFNHICTKVDSKKRKESQAAGWPSACIEPDKMRIREAYLEKKSQNCRLFPYVP